MSAIAHGGWKEVPDTSRAEVTGGCVLCDLDAGNYTEGLCNLGAFNC